MSELKPYAEMKDSGVTWLGDVPAHWKVRRGKTIFRRIDERSATGREELLTVSSDRGVVPRKTVSVSMFKAESYVGYKLCSPGDLVINSLWAWGRGLGISRYRGIISTAYGVYRVRHSAAALPDFIHSLVRSAAFNWELRIRSKGIWISRLQLTDESFLAAALPLPPLPEQTAIARFLDDATNRIERYIRAKEKLITLMEEQKQVIVHDAVTGRIDVRTGKPYPAYKPSGVEWLGEVPAHWDVLPLKRWVSTKITDGPHETPDFSPTGISFVSAEAMVGGGIDFRRRRGFISREQHEAYCRKCRPQRDDIFMCKSGATTGKVAIVETDDEFSVWSPLALIRVNRRKVLARLLFQILQSPYVQRQVMDTWSYGTQPNLAMGAMERITIALPHLSEQADMAHFLDDATANTSRVIGHANHESELLREYRTRLIADVVTGKLDVREAATALPADTAGFDSESASIESDRPCQQGPIGTGSA